MVSKIKPLSTLALAAAAKDHNEADNNDKYQVDNEK